MPVLVKNPVRRHPVLACMAFFRCTTLLEGMPSGITSILLKLESLQGSNQENRHLSAPLMGHTQRS